MIALVLDRFVHGLGWRSLMLLPWLMPNVVVALLFLWILDPGMGILNEMLEAIGLSSQPFLGSVDQAMPAIAGINIWRHVGYTALLILAGMQRIPYDIYEAGALDGASEMQMFRQLTLPLLRPIMLFVLVTSIVGSFQIYDTIAVTTQGGPVDATRVIYWFIYQHAFERYNFGYASAASIILFGILIVISLIQMRVLRANESDLA
jgi:multiple sugar transport system permease protein